MPRGYVHNPKLHLESRSIFLILRIPIISRLGSHEIPGDQVAAFAAYSFIYFLVRGNSRAQAILNRIPAGDLYKVPGLGTGFQRKISLHSQFEAIQILFQDLRFVII